MEKRADAVNQIIDELVELNKELTHNAEIGRMVSQIRASLSNSAKIFNAFYKVVEKNCNAVHKSLDGFVKTLEGDKLSANSEASRLRTSIAKHQRNAVQFAKQLRNTKKALRSSLNRHSKEGKLFRGRKLEAENKLIVIRHVTNIINDELLNSNKPASLIQVNTISSKLQELKNLIAYDNDAMFASVVSSLIEMSSEQNLNDQNTLNKLLNALRRLEAKINTWRTVALKDQRRIVRLNQVANAAKLKSIRALSKLVVEARSHITGSQKQMAEIANGLGLVVRGIARKLKEKVALKTVCDDQARVQREAVQAYTQLTAKTHDVAKAVLNFK
jgi:hypothetical protein